MAHRITCANCKRTVATVQQVKDCFAGRSDHAVDPFASIPVGEDGSASYALRTRHDEVRFFRVTRRLGHRTWIMEQHGDQLVQMDPRFGADTLSRISVDPLASAMLYGQEIGRCAYCHRALTNEESRQVGIGPKCLKRGVAA